jgi:hypothetical protein
MRRDEKRVNLEIPSNRTDLVRALKIRAGVEGKTMSEVVCGALRACLVDELAQVQDFQKEANTK